MQEQSSTPQIEPNPQPNPQPSPQSQPQEPSRQDIKLSASRTEFRQYLTLALLSPFLVLLESHLFFFLPAMVASLFLMNLIMVAVASVKKHIPFSLALFLFLQPYCIILFVCFFLPTILHPVPGAGMLFGVALFVVAGGLILFIAARCIYKFSRRDNWHRISWPSWLSSMAKLVMPIICVLYLLQRILDIAIDRSSITAPSMAFIRNNFFHRIYRFRFDYSLFICSDRRHIRRAFIESESVADYKLICQST